MLDLCLCGSWFLDLPTLTKSPPCRQQVIGFLILHNYGLAAGCEPAQACLTLCNPVDSSPPAPGILQARTPEWVAISSSRGFFRPGDRTHISCTGRRILYHRTTWEAQLREPIPNNTCLSRYTYTPIPLVSLLRRALTNGIEALHASLASGPLSNSIPFSFARSLVSRAALVKFLGSSELLTALSASPSIPR